MILELIATLCAALFAGAAVYINLVEHPARMSLGSGAALAEWAPSYHRATLMQAPLALVGAIAAVAAGLTGGGAGWLTGGVLLGAVIPITLIVIFPTNRELLDPVTAGNPERAGVLLGRWNRLHAVRSLLSTGALVLFLVLMG
ncbi:MAG TPA: DUF1772 domain-containing protein [Longimicrobium sp.]|nr:DUF1772 domain-containing protein [Longimicrobium sp.]